MEAMEQTNILYGFYGMTLKIRIGLIIKKILFTFNKQPNAEGRYIFNAYRNIPAIF